MNAPVALAPRLASLSEDHQRLETLIKAEMRRPAPDFATLTALKRRKLAVKDRIVSLSRRAAAGEGGVFA